MYFDHYAKFFSVSTLSFSNDNFSFSFFNQPHDCSVAGIFGTGQRRQYNQSSLKIICFAGDLNLYTWEAIHVKTCPTHEKVSLLVLSLGFWLDFLLALSLLKILQTWTKCAPVLAIVSFISVVSLDTPTAMQTGSYQWDVFPEGSLRVGGNSQKIIRSLNKLTGNKCSKIVLFF